MTTRRRFLGKLWAALAGLVTLEILWVIGVWCRGAGMALVWPWTGGSS